MRGLNILIIVAVSTAVILLVAAAYLYPFSAEVRGVKEITFVRTGGFIGVNEKLVIKEDGSADYTSNRFGDASLVLDEDEAASLRDKTGFFTSDTVYTARPNAADYYIYRLTMQTGFDVKTIKWVDGWAANETLPSQLGEIEVQLESIIQRARNMTGAAGDAQERAVEIAKAFIIQASAFKFDGINKTLRLISAVTLESFPEQHVIALSFDSRHAGYGNREGQPLAQVITPHTARVTVAKDNVISATLQGEWAELNQIPLN